VQNLIFSTPTLFLCFKNWLLLLVWFLIVQNLSTPASVNSCRKLRRVQIDNISKTPWIKIIPAPGPVLIKNINCWSCSGWKRQTSAGVDSYTPDPAHLLYPLVFMSMVVLLCQETVSVLFKEHYCIKFVWSFSTPIFQKIGFLIKQNIWNFRGQ